MSWKATAWAKDTRGHRCAAQKLILMVLADYHNTEIGYAYPSQKTLAADCEMTTRSIIRHIKALHDDGFINITPTATKKLAIICKTTQPILIKSIPTVSPATVILKPYHLALFQA